MAIRADKSFVHEPGEQLDRPVVIDGPDHVVEIHSAVEEAPGHIAHQSSQKGVDRNHMRTGWKSDVRKIFIALESKFSGREGLVAELGALGRSGCNSGWSAHMISSNIR
jgi:hypothetical protein